MEAEEWYRRGLEALRPMEPGRALWQLQSNLSLVTRRAGDLEGSREWLQAARTTVDTLGDSDGKVYVLTAEGLLLVASGDPATAEIRYLEALEHASSSFAVARVLVNLGESLLLQRKVDKAEAVFRRLELLALTEGLTASLPHAYRGLGAVARERGDPEGFLFFEQALELCRTSGLPQFELALTQLEYAEFELQQKLSEAAAGRLEEALGIFAGIGTEPERQKTERLLKSIGESAENKELDG